MHDVYGGGGRWTATGESGQGAAGAMGRLTLAKGGEGVRDFFGGGGVGD